MKRRPRTTLKRALRRLEFSALALAVAQRDRPELRDYLRALQPARVWIIYGKRA